MQQCAEGWHRTDEPGGRQTLRRATTRTTDEPDATRQTDDVGPAWSRRVRSTRRRSDAPDLPRVAPKDRTVGGPSPPRTAGVSAVDVPHPHPAVLRAECGRVRRSTRHLRLPPGRAGRGGLPELVDRFWQNLRRCAGYRVQYFAAVEPQQRLAPHLHAAIRGAIPRQVIRQVVRATYLQLWWPTFDTPVYVDRRPGWDGRDYVDPDTGEVLPTWQEALDQVEADPTPAGACDPVRCPAGHGRHHRPVR